VTVLVARARRGLRLIVVLVDFPNRNKRIANATENASEAFTPFEYVGVIERRSVPALISSKEENGNDC
jgi:hypothetical protein